MRRWLDFRFREDHRRLTARSHNRIKYNCLPLTEGFSLGLSYDLRLQTDDLRDSTPTLRQLTDKLWETEGRLRELVTGWAFEIEATERENHPVLFVLDEDYEPRGMHLGCLSAAGRAKVLSAQACAEREEYGEEHHLRVYLVVVKATAKNCGDPDVSMRVKYVREKAADVNDGMQNSAEELVIDDRCVFHPEMFADGLENRRTIGNTTMTSRTRTVSSLTTCTYPNYSGVIAIELAQCSVVMLTGCCSD